jgi:hypothetical protein
MISAPWEAEDGVRRLAPAVYRGGFGVLTLVALGVQLRTGQQHPPFSAVNFFSFFTTLANLFGALVFLYVAATGARRSRGGELVRGAAALYLAITFLVYALLLSDIPLGIVQPWVNNVLHRVMPVAVALDWLFAPPRRRLALGRAWVWLVFPLVYVAYSLIRGAVTGWYPYPFLNPTRDGGYLGVAVTCVAITGAFVVLTAGLAWIGNELGTRREQRQRGW